MGSTIFGGLAALVLGSSVAAASVYGLVSSQTSAPENSPTSVESAVVEYGTN